jgi:cell fate regulator YaaT (PSP1 superfamily)
MRMAKMQKATLDPSKISGYCGRLKCCLRYEDQTYVELKRNLPKKNTWVRTKQGEGKVIDTQILTQLVVVEHENGDRVAFPLEEISVLPSAPIKKKPPEEKGRKQEQEKEKKSPPSRGRRRGGNRRKKAT